MIILGLNRFEKVLLPQPRSFWMPPSQRPDFDPWTRDAVKYRWQLSARVNDGHIVWRGWFEDRDDADEFLFAMANGTLQNERVLWDLPTPAWRPDIGEHVQYDFLTQVALTGTAGSNQTYSVPSDFNPGLNTGDTIGGGASGGLGSGTSGSGGTGGGAGGASRKNNVPMTPSGSATYQLGLGGTAVTANGNGVAGGDTWLNATTYASASSGAKGGSQGKGSAGSNTAASGGLASSGIGDVTHNGGNGAATSGAPTAASGGGSAATVASDGLTATAASSNSTAGANSVHGESGGTAGNATNGGAGAAGLDNSSVGSGAGGGGTIDIPASGARSAGSGGNYGGAGGGLCCNNASTRTTGAGVKGYIFIQYSPGTGGAMNLINGTGF